MKKNLLTSKLVSNSLINIDDEMQIKPSDILSDKIRKEKQNLFFINKNKSSVEKVILKSINILKKIELKNFNQNELLNANKIQRDFVAISSKDEIYFIKMQDIMFCKALGKFTEFFLANDQVFLSNKNIGEYENQILDEKKFFRVHNSYIVNIRFVSKIDKRDGMSCELLNGNIVPVATRRIEQLNRFIGI